MSESKPEAVQTGSIREDVGFPLVVEWSEEQLACEDFLGFLELGVMVVKPCVGVRQADQLPEFGCGLHEVWTEVRQCFGQAEVGAKFVDILGLREVFDCLDS